ncbi:hypothetical protein G9A89_007129 [Geosiphon pyriformis]|nr:hypothetical protein G9A89_007129 [Geosiphon pyriformis]
MSMSITSLPIQTISQENFPDPGWFSSLPNCEKGSIWKTTLFLENNGSVARDHLANERTFLAWLRTSLSFIGIGLATAQLFRLTNRDHTSIDDRFGQPLGITFIMLGIMFLFFGVTRYFLSQTTMIRGQFPATRGAIILAVILTTITLIGCLVIIIVVGRVSRT